MNPCTCGGCCPPGRGCRPVARRKDLDEPVGRFYLRWWEVLFIVVLVAVAVWQWHDMAAAGEMCDNFAWAC